MSIVLGQTGELGHVIYLSLPSRITILSLALEFRKLVALRISETWEEPIFLAVKARKDVQAAVWLSCVPLASTST